MAQSLKILLHIVFRLNCIYIALSVLYSFFISFPGFYPGLVYSALSGLQPLLTFSQPELQNSEICASSITDFFVAFWSHFVFMLLGETAKKRKAPCAEPVRRHSLTMKIFCAVNELFPASLQDLISFFSHSRG